jgi:Ser-tRNA(Ala) deacylase AlaX
VRECKNNRIKENVSLKADLQGQVDWQRRQNTNRGRSEEANKIWRRRKEDEVVSYVRCGRVCTIRRA